MRITLTFNLKQSEDESEAELFTQDYVDQLVSSLEELKHHVIPIEVSGPPRKVVDDLVASRPDLIFNMAEGIGGKRRESYYPAIYELLGVPYTGGTPGLLHVGLDKRLAVKLLEIRGIRVPDGALLTPRESEVPNDLLYPQIIKPNYEGSSMGITQDSIVNSKEEAQKRVSEMIEDFPEGLIIEQYIKGRELTVPMLSAFEGYMLEIVEYRFEGKKHKIFDYETKAAGGEDESLKTICPPELTNEERREVLTLADRAFRVMRTPDFARADIRLSEDDGQPYLIEVNPLPGLRPISPLITGAEAKGLDYIEVLELIIRSAKQRYNIEVD
jgi:D-alanine--D-alanine ligase